MRIFPEIVKLGLIERIGLERATRYKKMIIYKTYNEILRSRIRLSRRFLVIGPK